MDIAKVRAKDVMKKNVIKVLWSAPISELERLFQAKGITGAPVVDDYGTLYGVVSETDIVNADLVDSKHHSEEDPHPYFRSFCPEEEPLMGDEEHVEMDDENEKRVEDIMTPWMCTAKEETPLTEIAQIMVKNHIHRILIVDGKSQLKGIVTTIDIARAVAQCGGKDKVHAKRVTAEVADVARGESKQQKGAKL